MHKGHPECIFKSKSACDLAAKIERGKCAAMTGEDKECPHWAVDTAAGRGYCGQHLHSVLLRADNDRRAATKRAELDGRITEYLAWRETHPSLHDRMPREA